MRVINSLEVGRLAALESRTHGRITMAAPPAAAAGGEMGAAGAGAAPMADASGDGGRGGYEGGEGMGGRGGAGGAGRCRPSATPRCLLRAISTHEEKPLAAPDPAAGVAAFGTEYKRLPVRMELVMDVRWLPHLIAECADAPLQVEVKEVRINPSESGVGRRIWRRGGRRGLRRVDEPEG